MGSFMAFGLGYVARPLGALLLGSYGDRAGRKAALTMTIMLMALGTLLIAIAPPYAAIGIGAPLLIVCGRVLQGFSAGGEIGGATAFLVEHAPPERRGSTPRGCKPAWVSAMCWAPWWRPSLPPCSPSIRSVNGPGAFRSSSVWRLRRWVVDAQDAG